jgi:hypothetical protein
LQRDQQCRAIKPARNPACIVRVQDQYARASGKM